MEKRIVVGHRGEIGSAIFKIFKGTLGIEENIFLSTDGNEAKEADRTVMHVCIPYTDKFIDTVVDYVIQYAPDIIIIHTTCAIGTTRKLYAIFCDADMKIKRCTVVHASVNCRHPNTEADIRKYDMFVGALNEKEGNEACDYIERFGVITYLCDTPESSEFNKIAGTEYCKTMVKFFGTLKELADGDAKLNWKESIAYFENLMSKSDGWKRVYRRGNRIDTPISGKHCLNSNNRLWRKYITGEK